MATLLFRLRNVPEDEAEEVRQLLEAHAIAFYETDAGNWGISLPALWLQDESQHAQASALLLNYQQERAARVRADYRALRAQGRHPTLMTSLRENPVRFVVYTGLSAAVLYLSVSSFFGLGD